MSAVEISTNSTELSCPHCRTVMLRPQIAIPLVSFPHKVKGFTGLNDHSKVETTDIHRSHREIKLWHVKDVCDFENIAIIKKRPEDDNVQFLACAECEKGPVGFVWLGESEEDKQYYLASERVDATDTTMLA
ncbi:hypothetical protein ACOME3_008105 [Neoechinorhynchus agilis]